MKKTKLTRERCDMKPSQMPPLQDHGADFDRFCAAPELIFLRLLNAALE